MTDATSTKAIVKTYSAEEETFWRGLVVPVEDRQLFTTAKWSGGHRWFRSPNVVCIEHYRRPTQPRHAPVREGRRG